MSARFDNVHYVKLAERQTRQVAAEDLLRGRHRNSAMTSICPTMFAFNSAKSSAGIQYSRIV